MKDQTSFWGVEFPNWIVAVATALTVIAAVAAALYAKSAARSQTEQVAAAKEQVEAANIAAQAARDQTELSRRQLVQVQDDAQRAREEARESHRQFVRSQLDQLAPVVYARATPHALRSVPATIFANLPHSIGSPVEQQLIIEDNYPPVVFITSVSVDFVNCSDVPARVDIIKHDGEISLRAGQELVVPPRETRRVEWNRRFSSAALVAQEDVDREDRSFFQFEYWVRDLTHNVRDAYRFNSDLRYFKRDGSRLVASPEPPFPWSEDIAGNHEERVYERLEASESLNQGDI